MVCARTAKRATPRSKPRSRPASRSSAPGSRSTRDYKHLRCPFCAHDDSQVKDSRPTEDNTAIRRRRQCESCGARFTTFERVQLREIVVVKSGGFDGQPRREPFDRAKIEQSVALACRKRGVPQERLD